MAITIQMIETKEFVVRPNGYDPQEVDTFLDEIVDEMDKMSREIKVLKQEAAKIQKSGTTAASPQPSVGADETIRSMISSAQRVCDESISDAKKRSEDILTMARKDADHIVSAAREENKQLTAKVASLRETVADYKARFRQLLDEQLKLIGND